MTNKSDQVGKNRDYFNKSAKRYREKDLVDFDYFVSYPAYSRIVAEYEGQKVPEVLDIGAGTGISSLPLLEHGCRVTSVDVAEQALERLRERSKSYGEQLTTVCSEGGAFVDKCAVDRTSFDIVLCRALLHHIPDYIDFIGRVMKVVREGGYFVSFADPLRYDSISRFEYLYARLTYYTMRVFKGNYIRGLKTLLRRSKGTLSDKLPEDNVEYHVVRNGVDQDAIRELLVKNGFECEITPYFGWNNPIMSPLGRVLGIRSSFLCVARRIPCDG